MAVGGKYKRLVELRDEDSEEEERENAPWAILSIRKVLGVFGRFFIAAVSNGIVALSGLSRLAGRSVSCIR
jgi:hypothetical protein